MKHTIALVAATVVAVLGIHKCTANAADYAVDRQQQANPVGGLLSLPFTIAGAAVQTAGTIAGAAIALPFTVITATGRAIAPPPPPPEPVRRKKAKRR